MLKQSSEGSGQPGTKAARHGLIMDVLAREPISSQEELKLALRQRGVEIAQATLSRDLLELQATKVRGKDGALVYTVPNWDGAPTHMAEESKTRLARWCEDLLVGGDIAQNLLVIRTPVGAANLLGSAIDSARLGGVVGTVAGDDTILLICRDNAAAKNTYEELMMLAGPSATANAKKGS